MYLAASRSTFRFDARINLTTVPVGVVSMRTVGPDGWFQSPSRNGAVKQG
jgi:hypothetical protein